MNTSKKLILSIIISLCTGLSLFAQASSSRVVVLTEVEGVTSDLDATLLKGSVRDKLEANVKKYTGFTVVSSNTAEIKNLQKETQSTGMDKNSAIRMGKILSADKVISTTIRKSTNYSLSIKFIDLTTGEVEASLQATSSTSDGLWSGFGCAVDEITILLCDELKLELTPAQRYVLQKGDRDLSTKDQLAMYEADYAHYSSLINEYDQEISSLDYSSDINAAEKQVALKAQKEIAEQKLVSSEAAKKRLEEIQTLQDAEAIRETERTEEQKKRRREIEELAKAKAAEVRKDKKNNVSVIREIINIENEKRAYVEIKTNLEERIAEIRAEGQEEKEAINDRIMNEPYPKAHLDKNQEPIVEAKLKRQNKVAEEQKKVDERVNNDIRSVTNSVNSELKNLYSTIGKDNAKLASKTRKASSVTNDILVLTGLYDGSKKAWVANLFFNVDGVDICQKDISLSYEKVTGSRITNIMDQEYIDNVDLYDSLFSRGTPVIIFELEYTVIAKPENRPSEYEFNLKQLILKDARNDLKILDTIPLNEYKTFKMTPAYDIRSTNDSRFESVESNDRSSGKTYDNFKVEGQKSGKGKKYDNISANKPKKNKAKRNCYYIVNESVNNFLDTYDGIGVGCDFALSEHLFVGLEAGCYSSNLYGNEYFYSDMGTVALFNMGNNFTTKGGFLSFFTKYGVGYSSNYLTGEDGLFIRTGVGLDVSIFEATYSLDYTVGGYFVDRVSFGFKINTAK